MVGKPIKKILIFGLPRTKTTLIQLQCSRVFGLQSLSEPYHQDRSVCDGDVYTWTKQQHDCVIKLLTNNLVNIQDLDFTRLWQLGWDRLIVTQRRSSTDTALSLYYAEQIARRYHYDAFDQVIKQTFEMPRDWLQQFWFPELIMWHQTRATIRDLGIEHDTIDYDACFPGSIQRIAHRDVVIDYNMPYIDTKIDYQELCLNYDQVYHDIKSFESDLC